MVLAACRGCGRLTARTSTKYQAVTLNCDQGSSDASVKAVEHDRQSGAAHLARSQYLRLPPCPLQ
eukprot:1746990-Pleurochrysis_carterae.AAC.1